jgi:hypothetical protein
MEIDPLSRTCFKCLTMDIVQKLSNSNCNFWYGTYFWLDYQHWNEVAQLIWLIFQVGSDVYLCYKKSMNRANLIPYKPGECCTVNQNTGRIIIACYWAISHTVVMAWTYSFNKRNKTCVQNYGRYPPAKWPHRRQRIWWEDKTTVKFHYCAYFTVFKITAHSNPNQNIVSTVKSLKLWILMTLLHCRVYYYMGSFWKHAILFYFIMFIECFKDNLNSYVLRIKHEEAKYIIFILRWTLGKWSVM